MTILARNAGYQTGIYTEQGGANMRLRRGTGLIGSDDELWGDCPIIEALLDPAKAAILVEDWMSYDDTATTGDYVTTQATAGTAAISTAATGVLELDCNSTTQGQGIQIQRAKAAFVPVAGTKIWFETAIKVVDTYDKAQLFIGACAIDTSIIASGSMSTNNHIGFLCAASGAGVLTFSADKASATGTTTGATLAEATYVRLGFYVNGVTSIQPYVNGVAVGTAIATANVPIVAIYPSFVCQTDGTNDPIMHVAGYRMVQTRA